jgi:hypothetical protein
MPWRSFFSWGKKSQKRSPSKVSFEEELAMNTFRKPLASFRIPDRRTGSRCSSLSSSRNGSESSSEDEACGASGEPKPRIREAIRDALSRSGELNPQPEIPREDRLCDTPDVALPCFEIASLRSALNFQREERKIYSQTSSSNHEDSRKPRTCICNYYTRLALIQRQNCVVFFTQRRPGICF